MYRTLADFAGLEVAVQPDVQGVSLAPLFSDPDHPPQLLASKPAFSQIARCECGVYTCWGPTSCNPTWNRSWYDPKGHTRGCNPLFATPENRSCFSCPPPERGAPTPPPRCGWSGTECGGNACAMIPTNRFDFMGYTMRTATRRFTAWVVWDKSKNTTDWTQPVEYELFDLSNDTGTSFDYDGYAVNVAHLPGYTAEVAALRSQLQTAVASWR